MHYILTQKTKTKFVGILKSYNKVKNITEEGEYDTVNL